MMATESKPNQLREALTEMRLGLQEMIEFQTYVAEIRWHSYNEHIKAGFTPEQALELCKKTTL